MLSLLLACAPPGDPGDTHATDTADSADTGPDSADSGDSADTGDDPGTVLVTVEDGYGSGRYTPGATTHIWAAADPQAEVVIGWKGEGVVDADAWNSPLVVPETDVVLTPEIEAVALPRAERTLALSVGEVPVTLLAPPDPSALVLFFHGARYDRGEIDDNAAATLSRWLVRAGLAVVALDSTAARASGTGGWDTSDAAENTDVALVREVLDALPGAAGLPADLPVVAWGMSSGGQFAHLVGAALPAAAVVAFCAPGDPDVLAATRTPTTWFLAARDSTFPDAIDDATEAEGALAARGVSAEVFVHPPTPLYPERFVRIAGIDAARSAAIVAELTALGELDESGRFVRTGAEVTAALDLAALDGLDEAQRTAVVAEIEIVAADHELYDDWGSRMVAGLAGL